MGIDIIFRSLGIDPESVKREIENFRSFVLSRDKWARDQAELTAGALARIETHLFEMETAAKNMDDVSELTVGALARIDARLVEIEMVLKNTEAPAGAVTVTDPTMRV